MNKSIIITISLLLLGFGMKAQQHNYAWKIGIHTGIANYYGDLSYQFWDAHHKLTNPFQNLDFIGYGLSVEHHFTRTVGLRLLGMKSQIVANDRTYQDNELYNRSLNVQTDIIDATLLTTIYLDNGRLLGKRAVIAPYFLIGAGLTYFDAKGDLLASDGGQYYYWSDKTIRNLAENDPNAATAAIIEQDQSYETSLRPLQTEGVDYAPFTWNVALGLGLKFRLSERFHIHLEGLVRYTGTDYLDDVSGNYPSNYQDAFQAYASNPSEQLTTERGTSPAMNDWYGFVGLSLHYSFVQKTYPIQPSIIYTTEVPLYTTETIVENTMDNAEIVAVDTVFALDTTAVVVDTIIGDTTVMVEVPTDTTTVVEKTVKIDEEVIVAVDSVSDDTLITTIETLVEGDSVMSDTLTTIVETVVEKEPVPSNTEQWYQYQLNLQKQSYEHALEKQALEYRYDSLKNSLKNPNNANYELLEQRYKYERQLQEQAHQQALEQQAAKYRLELQQKEQALKLKDADNKAKELELNHQLYLQKQDYDYQLKVKALEYQLQLERLKQQASPSTGSIPIKEKRVVIETLIPEEIVEVQDTIKKDEQDTIGQLPNGVVLVSEDSEKGVIIEPKITEGDREINAATPVETVMIDNSSMESITEQLTTLSVQLVLQQEQLNQLLAKQNTDKIPATTVVEVPIAVHDTIVESVVKTVPANQQAMDSLRAANNALQLRIQALNLALAQQPITTTQSQTDTVRVVEQDSIYLTDKTQENLLRKELARQVTLSNDLVAKLAKNKATKAAQDKYIDSLNKVVIDLQNQQKSVTSDLEQFLNKSASTYVTKIYFESGRSSLNLQAKETLTTLVKHLEAYPEVRYMVKGFASKTGSKTVNQRLSRERAQEVVTYLAAQGVIKDHLNLSSLGDSESQSDNELDRRAEVHLKFE